MENAFAVCGGESFNALESDGEEAAEGHGRAELSAKPRVIASGGLAHMIAPDSRYIAEIDDMLTLDGLRILFERNRTAKPRSRVH